MYFNLPTTAAKSFYLIEKYNKDRIPIICVFDTDETVELIEEDIKSLYKFVNEYKILVDPSSNNKIPEIISFTTENNKRIIALDSLVNNKFDFILTTVDAIKRKTIPKKSFAVLELYLKKVYNRDNIIKYLSSTGYERIDFVDTEGEYAVRGEIIDIWSPGSELPVRIVFNGNIIESIRYFDIETQKSIKFIDKIRFLPAKEFIQSEPITTYFEFLTSNKQNLKLYIDENIDKNCIIGLFPDKLELVKEELNKVYLRNTCYTGNFNLFLNDYKKWVENKTKIFVFCNNTGEQNRLLEMFYDHYIKEVPQIIISKLNSGFYNPVKNLVIICYHEIFYTTGRPIRFPKFKKGIVLEGLWEISPGDYVVHEKYGIGRYRGLRRIRIGTYESEYIMIEYRGGDKLYIPIMDFHQVQKYIGIEGKRPRLYSLDTIAWEHAKQRARKSSSELAKQLYELYNQRKNNYRESFHNDTEFEHQLSSTFMYEETPDQLRCIEEVKSDMCKPYPMDRIVLGDVGFGKTEVAVRAAFKCVLSSKQVVLLAPTTVLAEQHYQTFRERLSAFPVNVFVLSRFQTESEQKRIIKGLKDGTVDIVIGTHRLLQKDIEFKNLGLLIIDDEHRFGVRQKEKIKLMIKSKTDKLIDVLSLTATPIPRTLSMAFSGIKDISVIETPPEGRMDIETYFGPYDIEIVKQAIYAEIGRQGQVFYLHNRIETITEKTELLRKLVPGIKFGIVHGRMRPIEIEKIMYEFLHNKIDCLVATTIIESGLDIPNVNTMIIENAELLGLAQLYQLRGRIGRGKIKAYCYMFHSENIISEDAKKRLQAIYEFTKLGSGFKLALRDMEIRGAGEILGHKQHGFIQEIGLNLYAEFLHQEVANLKGEKIDKKETVPVIELNISAFIPDDYITQDEIRITFYRRFIAVENNNELENLINEIKDRFGEPPTPVNNLVSIIGLKLMMKQLCISEIKEEKGIVIITFEPKSNQKIYERFISKRIFDNYKDIIQFNHEHNNIIRFNIPQNTNILEFIKTVLFEIANL